MVARLKGVAGQGRALLLALVVLVLGALPALATGGTAYDPATDLGTGQGALLTAITSVGSALVVVVASVAALGFGFRWLRRVMGR